MEKTIDRSSIFFIAEIGLNHNGNFGLIYEMIRAASDAGASCVKFQLGWRAGPGEINDLKNEEVELIVKCCSWFGVEPMFSVFNTNALKMLTGIDLNFFKIASRTVNEDFELVKKIVKSKKTTFISLGMWDFSNLPLPDMPNIHYLWCKSEYPALPWHLSDLPKDFSKGPYVGISDHSVGIEVPLMAITRGAIVVEKHFTLDKSDTTTRDHALSVLPDEFSQLVKLGKSIRANLNIGV
jgi:N,N'-diacetyllegionaminate synthase